MLQFFYSVVCTTEVIYLTGTARRTEKHQFIEWKISFVKDTEELLTYSTADTNYCYFHTLLFLHFCCGNPATTKKVILNGYKNT